jgi:hypothetical protein
MKTARNAPDWKDAARRRPLVGKIIRALRGTKAHRRPQNPAAGL